MSFDDTPSGRGEGLWTSRNKYVKCWVTNKASVRTVMYLLI